MAKSTHPGVIQLLTFFEYEHLPKYLQNVSIEFHSIAHQMDHFLEDGAEKTTCLRKLLEAKDCGVRQKLVDWKNVDKIRNGL